MGRDTFADWDGLKNRPTWSGYGHCDICNAEPGAPCITTGPRDRQRPEDTGRVARRAHRGRQRA